MTTSRSSSKNTRNMNLQPVLNTHLPWAHKELGFGMLGVSRKLIKGVIKNQNLVLNK
jgi:hypothetical protein